MTHSTNIHQLPNESKGINCSHNIDKLVGFTKIEIDSLTNLSESEVRLVNYHSIINLVNGVSGNITLLEMDLKSEHFKLIKRILEEFTNIVNQGEDLVDGIIINTTLNIHEIFLNEISSKGLLKSSDNKIVEKINLINEILSLLQEKIKEFIELNNTKYELIDIERLKNSLRHVCYLIAKNSKGRYGIFFDEEVITENDYFIDLDYNFLSWDKLYMPHILSDVIRDLTLNSRKYSNPGSKIEVKVCQNEKDISICVEDEGMGIPEDELETVFLMEKRGTNSSEINGFGLGLTKAYYTVKVLLGGEIYIKSELGKGTTIILKIPSKLDKLVVS